MKASHCANKVTALITHTNSIGYPADVTQMLPSVIAAYDLRGALASPNVTSWKDWHDLPLSLWCIIIKELKVFSGTMTVRHEANSC